MIIRGLQVVNIRVHCVYFCENIFYKREAATTMAYHFKPFRMAIIRKDVMTDVDKDVKKLEPSYIAVENIK